jgi:hemoglobin
MLRLPIIAPREPGRAASAVPTGRDLGPDDLVDLLLAFYAEIADDALLAPYFAELDMVEHVPRIASFWATVLFHTATYSGNAFAPHQRMPGLTPEHFSRWVATLERVIDARFAGESAERMKMLGERIAFSMQVRLGLPPFGDR